MSGYNGTYQRKSADHSCEDSTQQNVTHGHDSVRFVGSLLVDECYKFFEELVGPEGQ